MEFIKKNYEKVLLCLVLTGLVVAVVFLLFLVATEKERLEELRNKIINRTPPPLPALQLGPTEALLKRGESPTDLDLATTNKLFNPERWQRAADGRLIKMPVGGEVQRLEVTRITPLYFIVTLDSISVSDSGPRYVIGVEQQAAPRPRKQQFYTSPGEKKQLFVLREAQGSPENPTALVLELSDSGEKITIARDKPFRRVDGYMADLKYPPESRTFLNRRVDAKIFFGGVEYIVVAISPDEVVLSAPNQKKWIVKPGTAP
jgi:hypothetical protein